MAVLCDRRYDKAVEKLPGDYIAGFVDGEGCFALKFRRDIRYKRKGQPVYFYWDIEFAILLRGDDRELLERIMATLDCGRISMDQRGAARYAVNVINDLSEKIVPFFMKYHLHGKKRHDFELWREALVIFKKNYHPGPRIKKGERKFKKAMQNPEDVKHLQEIHEAMKLYKSKRPAEWKWLSHARV